MARILIVDDDEYDRVLGSWLLQETGHEMRYASGGRAALEIFEAEDIDLVITDLVMPDLNGLRLIQGLIELDPGVKIIAMSGSSPEQLPRAEELGAALTFAKPVERAVLVEAVRRLLDGPQATPTDLFG